LVASRAMATPVQIATALSNGSTVRLANSPTGRRN
jgi:hypothetical protein